MNVDLLKPMTLCQLQKAVNMGVVAVYAAVGYKTVHMEGGILCLCILYCLYQCLVFKKYTILNLLGDTRQLLVYNTARAHIQMSYLGVAHLSVGKPYGQSACIALHEGILCHQLIHYRCLCLGYRIAVCSLIQAVAVQNHQYCRFLTHRSSPPLLSLLFSSEFCSSGCFRIPQSHRPL